MRYYFKSKTMTGFKFKQFEIRQDRCAMKVGTDGVLLGAWAPGGKRILDVGSGTGLISLMMAQRFPEAQVLGIDMDGEACEEAAENVAASPFADRVKIECCRLQDYHSAESFDAIVSNPPFFLNSLKNPDSKRTMARHTDSLPFRDLFRGAKMLLSDDGVFSVIVPSEVLEVVVSEACMLGFYLVRQCGVKTVERKQPSRIIVSFTKEKSIPQEQTLTIMEKGKYTSQYISLVKEFYLFA